MLKLCFRVQDLMQNMMAYFSTLLSMIGSSDDSINDYISHVDEMVVYMIEQLTPMVRTNLTLQEMFKDNPQTLKLINQLDNGEIILQVLLNTIVIDPSKVCISTYT